MGIQFGGGDGGGQTHTLNIPTTTLGDGENINQRLHVPDGTTYAVRELEAQTPDNVSPADVTVSIEDEANAETIAVTDEKYAVGDPLGEISGATDVALRVANNSGGEIDVSAMTYIEES